MATLLYYNGFSQFRAARTNSYPKYSDVVLDEVNLNSTGQFEHYLYTVKKIGHNTAMR